MGKERNCLLTNTTDLIIPRPGVLELINFKLDQMKFGCGWFCYFIQFTVLSLHSGNSVNKELRRYLDVSAWHVHKWIT